MDFATKQEIYLCSNTGCKHNTPDCPAVFVMDEFPICTSGIFSYGNKIYVLSKGMDNEGAVTQDFYDPDGQLAETEASQAALYEMDTDGTNRHKVYSFDVGLTVRIQYSETVKGFILSPKSCLSLQRRIAEVSRLHRGKLFYSGMRIPKELRRYVSWILMMVLPERLWAALIMHWY